MNKCFNGIKLHVLQGIPKNLFRYSRASIVFLMEHSVVSSKEILKFFFFILIKSSFIWHILSYIYTCIQLQNRYTLRNFHLSSIPRLYL